MKTRNSSWHKRYNFFRGGGVETQALLDPPGTAEETYWDAATRTIRKRIINWTKPPPDADNDSV